MSTSKIATVALLLAALGSGYAAAADTATQGLRHAQVLAELADAQPTGDILDVKSGKKLNERYAHLYPSHS